MTKITCTRMIEFDAAHRIPQHESKCRNVHGHRYRIEATFEAKGLDALGRVIDFGVIKEKLGAWVDEYWDHNTILSEQDKKLGDAIAAETKQKIYYLPYSPTAENMAKYLLEKICPHIFNNTDARCVSVRLYETPNCYAEVK